MRPTQAGAAPTAPVTSLWYFAAIPVIWSYGYTVMLGSDLWWHLAGGRWMVENRTVFVRDPYSFTAAHEWWLNDAWLADVFLHAWAQRFGRASLVYWKWACLLATWLLLFHVLIRIHADRLSAFVAMTFGLAVAAPFLDVRPQLFSFLGFVVLLELTAGRDRPSAGVVALFFLWANLHAGFLIGVLALPILVLPVWLREPAERRRVLLLVAICWAVCLVNPSGIEAFSRPLRYALDPTSPFRELGEWQPPFRPGGIRSWLYPYAIAGFGLSAGVTCFAWWRGRTRPQDWVALAVALATLAMSLRSRRFVPFFAIAQAVPVSFALRELLGRMTSQLPAMLAPSVALALGLFWIWPYPKDSAAFHFVTADYEFPIDTCGFAEANELSGRVFNYYNWGGYLHLCTRGQLKVFVDGRSETVYSDETFLQYIDVLHERPGWRNVIERSGADFVLWPSRRGRVVRTLAESGDWIPLYSDSVSTLLARAAAHDERRWKPSPETPYRSLTLGFVEMNRKNLVEAERHFEHALDEDRYLLPACNFLAMTHALAGHVGEVARTFERCRAIFPVARSTEWEEKVLGVARSRER